MLESEFLELAFISRLLDSDATEIRKNQVQVDVNGNKVGNNRPDIQYDYEGKHRVKSNA
ncbi:MAG: hypothetical protein IKY79_04000 [Bacteroidales bacterium]|nr:hypothetical protein [Bacteroidales bacterium]